MPAKRKQLQPKVKGKHRRGPGLSVDEAAKCLDLPPRVIAKSKDQTSDAAPQPPTPAPVKGPEPLDIHP